MFADIDSLLHFYRTPLGQRTQHILAQQLAALWANLRGENVGILGYGGFLLPDLARQGASAFAFMPGGQGVAPCPASGSNLSCLVDCNQLPLSDQSVDKIIMLHALEGVTDPILALSEIWRVMKDHGRLLVIIPNRMGLWAHSDHTPFGHGQPYSATQIRNFLQGQGFCIEKVTHALYAPPSASRLCLALGDGFEKYAARFFPAFGGVILVEASKQMHEPVAVKSDRRGLGFSLPFPDAPLLPT